MPAHVANLDLRARLEPPQHCPSCGSAELTAVPLDDRTGFRCGYCGASWYVCFGVAQPLRDTASSSASASASSPASPPR